MFKKLLLTTAILTSSSVAFAGSYVGASIGVNSAQFNSKDSSTGATLNTGGNNPNANVFAGYGSTINQHIYLGGEAFVDTTLGTISTYPTDASIKYKTNYSYGVSLIPGVLLSDHTMVYARAGVVRTNFNVRNTFDYSASGGAVGSGDNDTSVAGAQAGLGLQTGLTQNLDLRTEYVYSDYRTFNSNGYSISPTSSQVNFGLVYNIN